MDPCVTSTSGRGRHAAACAQQHNIGRGAAAQAPLKLVCRQQRRELGRSRRTVVAAAAPPPGETPDWYRCGGACCIFVHFVAASVASYQNTPGNVVLNYLSST
jgi:hypothetical protein